MIYTKNESCIYNYSKQLVILKTKLYSIESEYREVLELIDLFLLEQDSKNFKRLQEKRNAVINKFTFIIKLMNKDITNTNNRIKYNIKRSELMSS